MLSLTLFIAIVGAVTGIISLLVQYKTFKRDAPKLIIKEHGNSFRFSTSEFPLYGFNTKEAAVISFKLSNSSAHPITIDEVNLLVNSKLAGYHVKFESRPYWSIKVSDNTFRSYDPHSFADLPLRIEEYDSVYNCFCFPFMGGIPNKFTLEFVTPRKVYKVKAALFEIHEYHDLHLQA